ncbi:hypothetical protein BJ166DRAFT_502832 [Pestalotiopsis sp. NC0098]|nr:hypothetical protein BJ166DRAFT_502832 [Pestalotiopsis sp. NC0098]
MNKWMLYEIAQAKRIPAHKSKYTEELTESLPGLYLMAFETISLIREFFKSKISYNQRRGPKYEEVIRGLCHRLAWNDDGTIAEPAKTLHGLYHSGHNWGPHEKVWEGLLRDLIIQSRNRTLFIIDALDECSTRRQTEVEAIFQNTINRYSVVTTEAKKDMEAFLDIEITKIQVDPSHATSIFHEENLKRLRDALISQANGMFRWVQLWLGVFFNPNRKSIVLKRTAKEMLEMLESGKALPPASQDDDIAQVYQKLWDINGDGNQNRKLHQMRVFRFVLAAEGPLNIYTLLDAIRFDPKVPEEYAKEIELPYLETLYHNFLREQRGYLEFEHVSAKTFILEMQDSDNKQTLFADELENHRTIAETSILLLSKSSLKPLVEIYTDTFEWLGRSVRPKSPGSLWKDFANITDRLPAYILHNWLIHYRKSQDNGLDTELQCLLLDTLSELPAFVLSTANTMWPSGYSCTIRNIEGSRVVCPLLFALTNGLFPFHYREGVIDIWPNLGNIMTRNSDDQTVLHIAVGQNSHRSFMALLDIHSRADPNVPLLWSVESRGRNLLHMAKNSESVKALLEFEAQRARTANTSQYKLRSSNLLQGMDKKANTPTNNLLEHCDENSVLWVMERFEFAYYGVPGAFGRPIWHIAVRRGFKCVIRLLLDRGASVDGIDCPDGTALGVAAALGNEDMVMFLLEQDADVNRPGGVHGTPLGAAVYNGRDKVIALFLRHKDLKLERAIRLSPYDHDEMWNHVGTLLGADESAGDFKWSMREHRMVNLP